MHPQDRAMRRYLDIRHAQRVKALGYKYGLRYVRDMPLGYFYKADAFCNRKYCPHCHRYRGKPVIYPVEEYYALANDI